MRALTKSLGLLAILATATVLRADDDVPDEAPSTGAAVGIGSANGPLTPAEMQAKASDILGHANDAYRSVLAAREQAKRQHDAIKLSCVNNKLIQLKAQLNIA